MANIDCDSNDASVAMIFAQRIYLYGFFHLAFGGAPNPEAVSRLFSLESCDAIAQYVEFANERAGDSPTQGLLALHDFLEERVEQAPEGNFAVAMKGSFEKLYDIPGDQYVYPWESPYLGNDATLFKQSTLDVRARYHADGFKLKAEKHFPDDHVSAMMEFMGHLSQQVWESWQAGDDEGCSQTLSEQEGFAQEHLLDWLPKFARKTAEKDDGRCYAALAEGMASFVQTDVSLCGTLMGGKEE